MGNDTKVVVHDDTCLGMGIFTNASMRRGTIVRCS